MRAPRRQEGSRVRAPGCHRVLGAAALEDLHVHVPRHVHMTRCLGGLVILLLCTSGYAQQRRRRNAARRRKLKGLALGELCAADGPACSSGLECVCDTAEGRRLFGAPAQSAPTCTCELAPLPPSSPPPPPPPSLPPPAMPLPIGGSITEGSGFRMHVFTASDSFAVSADVTAAYVLLVGGGGGCAWAQ